MTIKHEIIINKAFPVPAFTRPSDSFIGAKLKESKRKVGKLVLFNLLICPFLCGIALLSLWGDLNYEGATFLDDIYNLVKNINGCIFLAFLMLWLITHTAEVFLIFAIATDNLRFCRTYLTTIAPLLWTTTILSFSLVMWSGLNPLENNSMTKFIIVFGSSTILVANFLSYYLKTLSEHVNYLSIFTMINERSVLIEYV